MARQHYPVERRVFGLQDELMKIIALFLALVVAVGATVRNSPTTSFTDVSNTLATCVSGDTLAIPAGSSTWTSTLNVSGLALTITGVATTTSQGSGTMSTHITNGVVGNGGLINVICNAANFVKLSGLDFVASQSNTDGMLHMNEPGLHGTREVGFQITNCKFTFSTVTGRGCSVFGIWGLIDHCTSLVGGTGSLQTFSIYGADIGSDGGFTPWTFPLTLGTTNAVYIEDCVLDYDLNDQAEDSIDMYTGGRVVIRHNLFKSVSQGFHGTDSGNNRSPHSFEVYQNTYINNSNINQKVRYCTVRGGTGVIWGNTYSGTTDWNGVTVQFFRAYSTQSAWQQCDGTVWQLGSTNLSNIGSRTCSIGGGVGFNSTDKETLGTFGGSFTRGFDGTGTQGYPGRDQPGYTTGQVANAVYMWNQTQTTFSGLIPTAAFAGGVPADQTKLDVMCQANREWFDNGSTPKPGYTPLAYPYSFGGSTASSVLSGKIVLTGKVVVK